MLHGELVGPRYTQSLGIAGSTRCKMQSMLSSTSAFQFSITKFGRRSKYCAKKRFCRWPSGQSVLYSHGGCPSPARTCIFEARSQSRLPTNIPTVRATKTVLKHIHPSIPIPAKADPFLCLKQPKRHKRHPQLPVSKNPLHPLLPRPPLKTTGSPSATLVV